MTHISPESHEFIEQLVASGRFRNHDEAIEQAVRCLRDALVNNGDARPHELPAEQWCERFDRWAAAHRPLAREADDSRESIYADPAE
jgi:Arc/MetJ-type ribon-helix-helix transcriptional regulator